MVEVTKKLLKFQSKKARTTTINRLKKDGFNYFVQYTDKGGKLCLQFAKSTAGWVKKNATNGIWISGNN